MNAGPPPWGTREPAPERTPEGLEIVATRFGPHFRGEDGRLYPLFFPQEQTRMALEPMLQRDELVVVPQDWSPW